MTMAEYIDKSELYKEIAELEASIAPASSARKALASFQRASQPHQAAEGEDSGREFCIRRKPAAGNQLSERAPYGGHKLEQICQQKEVRRKGGHGGVADQRRVSG